MTSNFGANIRILRRFFRLSSLFLIFALLQEMALKNTAVWVWLLLLPGLLGSWGGRVQTPLFNQYDSCSDQYRNGNAQGFGTHELAGHQGQDSECNKKSKDAQQESDSKEPNIPVQSPLFLSAAPSASLNAVVYSGTASSSTLINWFLNELNGCGLHIFSDQHYTSWHVSQLLQRTLRLRTWFTCIMPAQAP
jgi:hypothetical protein